MNWVGKGRNHTRGKNEVFLLQHVQGNYSVILNRALGITIKSTR